MDYEFVSCCGGEFRSVRVSRGESISRLLELQRRAGECLLADPGKPVGDASIVHRVPNPDDRPADQFRVHVDHQFHLLVSTPQIRKLLESPRISHLEKERILNKAFAEQMDTTLLNFLKVLSRHGRMDCLFAIEQSLRDQYNSMQNRVEVQLTSATPLDDETRSTITSQLTASLDQEVELVLEVNPELIGGTIVRIGDTVYDGSVAHRLARIRQETLDRSTMEFQQESERFTSGDPD